MNLKKFKNQLLLGICGVLTILTVVVTVSTATTGAEMSRLEKEEATLTDQRRDIQESFVKTLSTHELEDKSGSLGFAKPADIVYISALLPVANLPQ
jgi:hypothetical protein